MKIRNPKLGKPDPSQKESNRGKRRIRAKVCSKEMFSASSRCSAVKELKPVCMRFKKDEAQSLAHSSTPSFH